MNLDSIKLNHNWIPVRLNYPDSNIIMSGDLMFMSSTLDAPLYVHEYLDNTQDVAINNDTLIFLTGKKNIDNVTRLLAVSAQVITDITSYFSVDNTYLTIGSLVTSSLTETCTLERSALTNNTIFDVKFSGTDYLMVTHYDNYKETALTFNLSTGTFSFELLSSTDSQKFRYIIDRSDSAIVLFTYLSGYIVEKSGSLLVTRTATASNFLKVQNIFRIRDIHDFDHTYKLNPSFISYKSTVDTNNLDIDINRTDQDIENNFLLVGLYKDLTTDGILPTNIVTLKNQLTPNYRQPAGNIFTQSSFSNVRSYEKLFTGTNQEMGYDSINLSYKAGITEIELSPDKLTYFHFPEPSDPYTKIGVNRSGLVEQGAIPGDSPWRSDKIFKKNANYGEYTSSGNSSDSHDGTYLCSWLYYNPATNIQPTWYDRYYNPRVISSIAALGTLPTGNSAVYDIESDLTLEPGVLYAYHHMGPNDSNMFIRTLSSSLVTNTLNIFDKQNTTVTNSDLDRNGNIVYSLDSSRYGKTGNIVGVNTSKEFTISFTIDSSNWNNIVGWNILSNTTKNNGFALFRKESWTPYIITHTLSTVYIMNTDFRIIKEINVDYQIKWSYYDIYTDTVWVVTHDSVFIEINLTGTVIRSISPCDPTDTIVDISCDRGTIHSLVSSYIIGDDYRKIVSINTNTGASSIIDSTGSPSMLSSVSLDSVNSYRYDQSLRDSNGNIWGITDYGVYTVGAGGIESGAVTTASGYGISSFCISSDDSVWVAYNQSIAKLNSNRGIEFIQPVSALSGLNILERHINFIKELRMGIEQEYPFLVDVYSDSVSGKYLGIQKLSRSSGLPTSTVLLTSFDSVAISELKWDTKCITNYDYIRRTIINNEIPNTFTARLYLTTPLHNIYNRGPEFVKDLIIDISNIETGKHVFTYQVDYKKGIFTVYIDGVVYNQQLFSSDRYVFDNLPEIPVTIGSPTYIDGTTLNRFLDQPDAYLANSISMGDFRLYSKYIDHYDVQAIVRTHMVGSAINFIVPAGNRTYLEQVERWFKHQLPGRKSQYYNIRINNSLVTDSGIRSQIEDSIRGSIDDLAPAYTDLLNFDWYDAGSYQVEVLTGVEVPPLIFPSPTPTPVPVQSQLPITPTPTPAESTPAPTPPATPIASSPAVPTPVPFITIDGSSAPTQQAPYTYSTDPNVNTFRRNIVNTVDSRGGVIQEYGMKVIDPDGIQYDISGTIPYSNGTLNLLFNKVGSWTLNAFAKNRSNLSRTYGNSISIMVGYYLLVQHEPTGYGSTTGSGYYSIGTNVSVNAVPSNGKDFLNWESTDISRLAINDSEPLVAGKNCSIPNTFNMTNHSSILNAVFCNRIAEIYRPVYGVTPFSVTNTTASYSNTYTFSNLSGTGLVPSRMRYIVVKWNVSADSKAGGHHVRMSYTNPDGSATDFVNMTLDGGDSSSDSEFIDGKMEYIPVTPSLRNNIIIGVDVNCNGANQGGNISYSIIGVIQEEIT